MKKFLTLICLISLSGIAYANPPASQQQKAPVLRDPRVPISEGITIVGNQLIAPAADVTIGPRFNCLIVNTSPVNRIYISFGKPATLFSIPLNPNDFITCADENSINVDAIYLYDPNAGDTYYILSTIVQSF